VSTSAVVEDLEVLEDRVREIDASTPAAGVEQLDLHPRPERFDHRIVIAVADGAEHETLAWIGFYNDERLHEQLGDIPPAEYEQSNYKRGNINSLPT
jgi:transposase InsO family protein